MQHRNVTSTMQSRRNDARALNLWSSSLGANRSGSNEPAASWPGAGAASDPTRTPRRVVPSPSSPSSPFETSGEISEAWASSPAGPTLRGSRGSRSDEPSRWARFAADRARGGGGALFLCLPSTTARPPASANSATRSTSSATRSPVPPLNARAEVSWRSSGRSAPSFPSRAKKSHIVAAASTSTRNTSVSPLLS